MDMALLTVPSPLVQKKEDDGVSHYFVTFKKNVSNFPHPSFFSMDQAQLLCMQLEAFARSLKKKQL